MNLFSFFRLRQRLSIPHFHNIELITDLEFCEFSKFYRCYYKPSKAFFRVTLAEDPSSLAQSLSFGDKMILNLSL